MRPVYLGDLSDAARALRAHPPGARAALAQDLVRHADTADRFRKRLRRAHPTYGTGTLSSAARAYPLAPASPHVDREDLSCLALLIAALGHHKTRDFCNRRS